MKIYGVEVEKKNFYTVFPQCLKTVRSGYRLMGTKKKTIVFDGLLFYVDKTARVLDDHTSSYCFIRKLID